jgi:hypothetical protein
LRIAGCTNGRTQRDKLASLRRGRHGISTAIGEVVRDFNQQPGERAVTKTNSNETVQCIDIDQLNTVVGGEGGVWGFLEDAARYTTAAGSMVVTAPLAAGRGISEFAGSMRQGHSVGDSLASGLVQAGNTTGVLDRTSGGPVPALSSIPANPGRPANPPRR